MKVRIKTLRRVIQEELQRLDEMSYRNIRFDPDTGAAIDRNEGPVRGTEGMADWPRKKLLKWFQQYGTELVTPPGTENEMSVRKFLASKATPAEPIKMVRGEPLEPPRRHQVEPKGRWQ